MDSADTPIVIEHLTAYSATDAEQLGQLLTHLTSKATGEPVSKQWLEQVITSPYHTQIVARNAKGIVGAATLSLVADPLHSYIGYLESFVVDPDTRGQGIGNLLWDAMDQWCREKDVVLEFTSRADREAAQRFYLKHGAVIRDTNTFRYTPEDK